MSINDFFPYNSTDDRQVEITNSIIAAKKNFSENIPYTLLPSPLSRTTKIVIFSQHFIDTFRMMLSNPTSGCIVQMSDRERDVYYSYLEFVDGIAITDIDMLQVVTELDNCIVNELTCKAETYLDLCFSTEHDWNSVVVATDATTVTVDMTQAAYDIVVAADEMVFTTTYIITLNGVTVKVYLGGVAIWTAV